VPAVNKAILVKPEAALFDRYTPFCVTPVLVDCVHVRVTRPWPPDVARFIGAAGAVAGGAAGAAEASLEFPLSPPEFTAVTT
jgi:hypothetical protein